MIFLQEAVVERLDVSSNRVGHEGCVALAELLVHNATLMRLELQKNPLTDAVRVIGQGAVLINTLYTGTCS